MALQIALDKPETGESYPMAYHRVTQVQYNAGSHASVIVSIYKDAEARNAGKQPVGNASYVARDGDFEAYFGIGAMERSNLIKQAYTLLKTKPAFAGAKDV